MIRWIALFLVTAMSGGTCYWLWTQGRVEDMLGIMVMLGLSLWFLAGDAHVDEVFEHDAERAKREANS